MNVMASVRAVARGLGVGTLLRRFRPLQLRQVVWFAHTPDLRSRMFVANLVGEAGTEKDPLVPVPYELRVYSSEGSLRGRRRGTIGPDQTVILESAALAREMRLPAVYHGLAEFRFARETVRTLRPYVHYLTKTACVVNHGGLHSRLTAENDTLRERYPSFTKLLLDDETRVRLAVYNADTVANRARLVAVNGDGKRLESAELTLRARASAFLDVEDALPGVRAFLDGRLGSVHLTNPLDPVTMTWFVHNTRLGTLQCNHG